MVAQAEHIPASQTVLRLQKVWEFTPGFYWVAREAVDKQHGNRIIRAPSVFDKLGALRWHGLLLSHDEFLSGENSQSILYTNFL
jgi:hypothetical protein